MELAPFTHILLQNEIPISTTLSYLAFSKSPALGRRITTIYNPSPIPTPTQILHEIDWGCIDWLIVNEGEAQQLLDAFPASSPTSPPEIHLPGSVSYSLNLISRLASQPSFKGVNIICTLGPLGVLGHLRTKDGGAQLIYEPGVSENEVRDTTGAGDCWTGYLVAGLMELEAKSISVFTNWDKDDFPRLLRTCNQVGGSRIQFLQSTFFVPY
jgi:ribokinase